MNKKSAEWWVGQVVALYLGISAIGAYGFTAGGIVTYTLWVLIDIREYAKVGAEKTAPEGHNVQLRGAPKARPSDRRERT